MRRERRVPRWLTHRRTPPSTTTLETATLAASGAMEGAAAADGGAGADYLASLMFGVLKRMLDRGAFVVSNEDLQNKPLLYMTPRLLHVLVAEECMKTHGVYVINKIVEGALEAAFLEALGPRGIKPLRSLHHHARGRKHGIFVNVRPACIPSSWFGNKHEDLPAGLKQSALLKETVRALWPRTFYGSPWLTALSTRSSPCRCRCSRTWPPAQPPPPSTSPSPSPALLPSRPSSARATHPTGGLHRYVRCTL